MLPVLQTARLILRSWTIADAGEMFAMNQDSEVIRYTGNQTFKNKEEVLELINTYDQYEKYKTGRMTVLEKSTGEFAGWCGLKHLQDIHEIDLGYRLVKKHRGKGYATESSIAVLDYGFLTLGLERIIGRVVNENIASVNVLEKLGMKFEKEFEEHGYLCSQYALTRQEWVDLGKQKNKTMETGSKE